MYQIQCRMGRYGGYSRPLTNRNHPGTASFASCDLWVLRLLRHFAVGRFLSKARASVIDREICSNGRRSVASWHFACYVFKQCCGSNGQHASAYGCTVSSARTRHVSRSCRPDVQLPCSDQKDFGHLHAAIGSAPHCKQAFGAMQNWHAKA